jgi:hypothetical protein
MKTAASFLLCGLLLTMGCSTQSNTVKSESYETAPDRGSNSGVTRKTETTETETSSESGGILSGTVDIIGKTIALPFRAVGGLIDLAF